MNRGGAESMIMNYYRALDRTKIQFDFIVHRKEKGAFDDEIISLGGNIYKLNPINPLFAKGYYNELRDFLKKNKQYKIVHSHLNTFSCFPLKIAQELNIPCRIAHAHIAIEPINIIDIFQKKESIKENFKKIIKYQLKKKIGNYATHYFSCGEKAGKWLFGEKSTFTIMNNAIDAQKFRYNPKTSATYKNKYNVENKLVIGHVGRFSSQKNHLYLFRIFKSLLLKNPNSVLFLVGDGPMRQKLEAEVKSLSIEHNVQFLGVRTDIPELFQMMDVFVFPSFYEGLPVTLIEAQTAGLKVFASEKITKEVLLTNDITYLPIDIEPEVWVDKILQKKSETKKDNFELIKNKGYDIYKNTEIVQNFYLKQTLN
ncbi:glycosyltransferase family 1 protein [Tamlana sp. I1]|uniref:glycosyltransferase family 1 protein n=1 Tax=Tamlana sp. I1 TaxID=2762061 RepID=UPI00188FF5E3|nr:glycosyltransferase family 1 protein [Tamlana sp. I1]